MVFRRYLEIILRRKWIVILSLFLIPSTAIIGTRFIKPTYKSTVKVLIQKSDTLSSLLRMLNIEITKETAPTATERYQIMGSYTVKSTVRPILNELIFKLQLRDRHDNSIDPDDLIDSFVLKRIFLSEPFIKVEQYEDTDILEITATSPNPEEAMMMANTLAEMYINDQLKKKKMEYRSAREFVESQISKAESEYYDALEDIKTFNVEEKTVAHATEITNLLTKISTLQSTYEGNKLSIVKSKAAIKNIEAQLSKFKTFQTSAERIKSNDLIMALKKRLSEDIVKLSQLKTEKTDDHPAVVELNAQIKTTKELLKNEVSKVYEVFDTEITSDALYDEMVKSLVSEHTNITYYEAQEEGIKKSIDEYEKKIMTYPTKITIDNALQFSLSVKKDIYEKFLKYLDLITMAESISLCEINLIEPAKKQDILKPYFPKKKYTYLLGIFLGLFWGLGVAFFVEYMDDTLRTPEDLAEFNTITLLGTILSSKSMKKGLISALDPRSPVVEAYRVIKNTLKHIGLSKSIKSLVITSPERGNGRTTTAANLGISVAKEGKRVIIIDLDLRNPGIHERFGLNNVKGFTNYLVEDLPMGEIMRRDTGVNNLNIIPCGAIPSDPTVIIESPKIKEVIDELSREYDLILIDTPPLTIVNDALVLGNYTDALIIIVESGKTTLQNLKRSLELLKNADLKFQGIIFNKLKSIYGKYY